MSKIYSIFDKTAQKSIACFSAPNDGMAIRENAPSISRIIPLGDAELRHIADFDDISSKISPLPDFVVIDWNSYHFPENPIKPLDKNTDLSKSITQEVKNNV